MADKAIEILIRLRAETAEKNLASMADAAKRADKTISGVDKEAAKAERALIKMGEGAKKSEQGLKAAERGMNKMRGAIGGSSFVNDLDDVAEGIDAIGIGGAAAVIGLGAMTAAATKLGTEMIAIMRDVDALAPKFESLAGQEIISQESIDASHTATTNLDKLWMIMGGMVGVMVDRFAPAIGTVTGVFVTWGTAALNVYKILGDISKAMYNLDLGAFGDAVFGTTAKPKSTSIGASYAAEMGRTEDAVPKTYAERRAAEQAKAGATNFSSLTEGAAKIKAEKDREAKAAESARKAASSAASAAWIAREKAKPLTQMVDLSNDFASDDAVMRTSDLSAAQEASAAATAAASAAFDDMKTKAGEAATAYLAAAAALEESAAASKAAKAAKLNSIAGGLGTAQSILSSGTAGIASAVSSTGPAGAVVGAVMSLGDTLATMGTEGLQTMIDGVLGMPVTVLEMLPSILTETIPNILTEGIPTLVSGIILALPDIVIALAELVPLLVESLIKMALNMTRDLIAGFKDALTPGGGGKAGRQERKAAFNAEFQADWKSIGAFFRGGGGGDAYTDPSTGPRRSGGSTARTSAPASGGDEQHVHVHVGTHVGTDAKSARELARMLRSHIGTRGTNLALE